MEGFTGRATTASAPKHSLRLWEKGGRYRKRVTWGRSDQACGLLGLCRRTWVLNLLDMGILGWTKHPAHPWHFSWSLGLAGYGGNFGCWFPLGGRQRLLGPRLTRALRSPTSLPPQTMPSISSDRAALCAGCGGKISDRYYLLAVDKQWHMRCLKCCECKLNLESELTCFSKDGSIYCKEDYYR